MSIDLIEIKQISGLLNGKTPSGLKIREGMDFKTPRYMMVLYAACKYPIFEDLENDEMDSSFTLYSLGKIAKQLQLNFDRTKSSSNIYNKQIQKKRITDFKSDTSTGYKLSDAGIKFCEDCMRMLLPMLEAMKDKDAVYPYTEDMETENTEAIREVQQLSEDKQQEWLQKPENRGKLFRQPSKNETLIGELFRKMEELI